MKRSEQDFLHGLAYAASWIIRYHGEDAIALDLLSSSGYSYDDLVRAKCDQSDLESIAQALVPEPIRRGEVGTCDCTPSKRNM